MNPATLEAISLILAAIEKYGPPAALAISKLFQAANPTPEDWQALIAATSITARQQMMATLAAHGIDPASPQGVALLALTPA